MLAILSGCISCEWFSMLESTHFFDQICIGDLNGLLLTKLDIFVGKYISCLLYLTDSLLQLEPLLEFAYLIELCAHLSIFAYKLAGFFCHLFIDYFQ